jgi:hypothetical protein
METVRASGLIISGKKFSLVSILIYILYCVLVAAL